MKLRPDLDPHAEVTATLVLPTPEGVPLHFDLAPVGDRIVAFTLDALLIGLAMLALTLSLLGLPPAIRAAALWVLFFLLRHFYFLIGESLGRGASPGKRARRLRVADAAGGPLDARALVVRNLLREVDTFLPLSLIPMLPWIWPDAPGWFGLVVVGWVVVLGTIPLFDARHRRLGDLVAGTVVLRAPRRQLLPDLAADAPATDTRTRPAGADPGAEDTFPAEAGDRPARYVFTEEQLGRYGIYELQVLEGVLRQDDPHTAIHARVTVTRAIQEKIGWTGGEVHARTFLTDFYRALRADLERRMLLGDRREDKRAAERDALRRRPGPDPPDRPLP